MRRHVQRRKYIDLLELYIVYELILYTPSRLQSVRLVVDRHKKKETAGNSKPEGSGFKVLRFLPLMCTHFFDCRRLAERPYPPQQKEFPSTENVPPSFVSIVVCSYCEWRSRAWEAAAWRVSRVGARETGRRRRWCFGDGDDHNYDRLCTCFSSADCCFDSCSYSNCYVSTYCVCAAVTPTKSRQRVPPSASSFKTSKAKVCTHRH